MPNNRCGKRAYRAVTTGFEESAQLLVALQSRNAGRDAGRDCGRCLQLQVCQITRAGPGVATPVCASAGRAGAAELQGREPGQRRRRARAGGEEGGGGRRACRGGGRGAQVVSSRCVLSSFKGLKVSPPTRGYPVPGAPGVFSQYSYPVWPLGSRWLSGADARDVIYISALGVFTAGNPPGPRSAPWLPWPGMSCLALVLLYLSWLLPGARPPQAGLRAGQRPQVARTCGGTLPARSHVAGVRRWRRYPG